MSQERAVIRRAEVRDLSKVETVARATWRVAYAGIIPDDIQRRLLDSWYSRESLSRALAVPGSSFFVAESSGDVVGFAQFVRRSAELVELTRIYVLPDRQRSGVGDAVAQGGADGIHGRGPETPDRSSRARQSQWPWLLRAGRLCGAASAHPRRAGICARAGRIPSPDPDNATLIVAESHARRLTAFEIAARRERSRGDRGVVGPRAAADPLPNGIAGRRRIRGDECHYCAGNLERRMTT